MHQNRHYDVPAAVDPDAEDAAAFDRGYMGEARRQAGGPRDPGRDESIHDDGRPCRYVAGCCNLCGAWEPSSLRRHDDVPAGILPVVPAMRGGYRLWMHECGNVEGWLPGNAPADGGCDACESGSDDAADWRPLFVEPRRPERLQADARRILGV